MRRARWKSLLALVAGLALVAAACGGEGGEFEAEDLSGQSVEVWAVWSGGDDPGSEQFKFEQVLAAFEEATGADVTYTPVPEDLPAALGTAIEGGQPPDVAMLPQPGLLRDLADQGALQPIEDTAGALVDANYAPVWRDLGSVDGTLYGVWFKAANKSTFWYNVNVWEGAGVEPPEDWEGLKSAAQTISDFGVTPFSVGGADGWTLTDWFENVYIRTAGPEAYDQLTSHEIPWTDDTVKEALGVLGEIFGNEAWLVGGTQGALQTDFPTSVQNVFANPESPDGASVYEGDFVGGVISGETDSVLGEDADFFNFPAIEGSSPAVVGGGDVAVQLTDSPAAAALMQFLASPEAAEVWAALGGFTSPNQNVNLDVYPDAITRKSAEALTGAETFRFDLSDLQPAEFGATVGQGLFKLFQDFLANPSDIDGVTEQMESEAAAAFG